MTISERSMAFLAMAHINAFLPISRRPLHAQPEAAFVELFYGIARSGCDGASGQMCSGGRCFPIFGWARV